MKLALPLVRTEDGSVVTSDGDVLYFSADRFAREICEGPCCFICGANPGSTKFNREHILPDWVLRRYNLHQHTITLPNGDTHRYGTYRIPCCAACNSLLSEEYESPLSEVLGGGHAAVSEYIKSGGAQTLFTWLALIFLKTHLKDKSLRMHLRPQDGEGKIADDYAWEDFHHLHCLARSAYTGALVEADAYGSLLLLAAEVEPGITPFDMIDLSQGQTLVLRMDDFALCATFNDACAVINGLRGLIDRLRGALNWAQVREFAAHMACCNLHLENRPHFHTRIDLNASPHVFIGGERGEFPRFARRDSNLFGKMLKRVLLSSGADFRVPGLTREQLSEAVEQGKVTFLFDDAGEFIRTPGQLHFNPRKIQTPADR